MGKLVHEGTLDTAQASLVDFNRAGVPLMETVSRPDLRSPEEAAAYLRAFRAVLVALGVCDGNMEEGSLRCDANISLRPRGASDLGTKVEIKNLNSFRNVQRALEFEARRQAAALDAGERIVQETRLWDADAGSPAPCAPRSRPTTTGISPSPISCRSASSPPGWTNCGPPCPSCPAPAGSASRRQYGLPAYDAEVLTQSAALADYYERAVAGVPAPQDRLELGDVGAAARDPRRGRGRHRRRADPARGTSRGSCASSRTAPSAARSPRTSSTRCSARGRTPQTIVRREGLTQVSDSAELARIVADVVAANAKAVDDYKKGKSAAAKALVGQVMKATGGKANPPW